MQYLATKRLKALKWMFHKKYQTWFQMIGQPKNQTNEYLEGTFYYFDFERGKKMIIAEWQIRTKRDWKFELAYLENEIQ